METKTKTLKEKSTEIFNEWVTSSTSHALPKIFKSRTIIVRIMWIVLYLLCMGYCAYSVVKTFKEFYKYETSVSIKRVQELPQEFPAVTICNLRQINSDNYEYFNIAANTIENPKCFDYFQQSINCASQENPQCKNINTKLEKECKKGATYDDDRQVKLSIGNYVQAKLFDTKQIGYMINDEDGGEPHYLCKFNSVKCTYPKIKWTNEFGNCFTYNQMDEEPFSTLKTSDHGKNTGLELEIAMQTIEQSFSNSNTPGLYLIVHNQTEELETVLSKGVFLKPGNRIYVGIDRVFSYKQSIPYSDCIDDLKSSGNEFAAALFNFSEILGINYYSQDFCYQLCYEFNLQAECDCSGLSFPPMDIFHYCSTQKEFECLLKFESEFFKSDTNTYCNNACREKCKTIEYKYKLEYAGYPTDDEFNGFKYDFKDTEPKKVEKYVKENVMKVTVNYENRYYTTINESPTMSVESLIGNTGGQFGLFAGMSILTFIELVELVIDLLFMYWQHRKESKESGIPMSNLAIVKE